MSKAEKLGQVHSLLAEAHGILATLQRETDEQRILIDEMYKKDFSELSIR